MVPTGRLISIISLGLLMTAGWLGLVSGAVTFLDDPGACDGRDITTFAVLMVFTAAATVGFILLMRKRRKRPVQQFRPGDPGYRWTTAKPPRRGQPIGSDRQQDRLPRAYHPDMKRSMTAFLALAFVGLSGSSAAIAIADPGPDDFDNIYGLLTPDEEREIPVSGRATCVSLDQAHEADPPLSAADVMGVIEGFRGQGWDLESASDIVWEQVEGRCPEYLDAVKRAVRAYGDPS